MNALTRTHSTFAEDPALLGYPPLLPVELALREHSVEEVCKAFNISEEKWDEIRVDPIFVKDLRARVIELQTEGISFRMKARLQCGEYLKELWMIAKNFNQDKTPADYPVAIRVDVMKFIVRAAGLDGSRDQALAAQGAIGNALSITLHLGG